MRATKQSIEAHGLSEKRLIEMHYKMLLAQALSVRQRMLQRMGRGPITFSGEGHEAAQVGSASALRPGHDWVFPYYRDVGVVVTLGMTPRDVMMGFFAKKDDVSSGGRNMPSHFSHPELRIVSEGAPVGTQAPHAVGAALASRLSGRDEVSMTYFGEGATSTGDVHESMNFAGVHRLPVVFVCEFNAYAISVPWKRQGAVENVAARAEGYGFPGLTVDGNDVLAVYGAANEAVGRARCGEGPTLIEAKTYRVVPHSSDDDDRRYRTREEVAEWEQRGPVSRFAEQLREAGVLDDKRERELSERVEREVEDATEFAEKAPPPEPGSALRHVLVEGR